MSENTGELYQLLIFVSFQIYKDYEIVIRFRQDFIRFSRRWRFVHSAASFLQGLDSQQILPVHPDNVFEFEFTLLHHYDGFIITIIQSSDAKYKNRAGMSAANCRAVWPSPASNKVDINVSRKHESFYWDDIRARMTIENQMTSVRDTEETVPKTADFYVHDVFRTRNSGLYAR